MRPHAAVWALGPHDPEMRSIRYMLRKEGCRYAYAQHLGRRCVPGNAYVADGLSASPGDGEAIIWVECRSAHYSPDRDLIVDHHNPGDPGYDSGPADFWEGSSIGQVADLLGVSDPEYRLVAASDHCLSAAMRGECPGISPDDLMGWRITARASMAKIQPWLLRRRIERAVELIRVLPRIVVDGQSIVDGSFQRTPELRDAAAICGLPIFTTRLRSDGLVKVGLYGATPSVTQSWLNAMSGCADVQHTYGCPSREYAGSILNSQASNRMRNSVV